MTHDVELSEAVAVVGMSCRFAPDLDSPDKLWEFLANGRSAVGDMPAKRWEPYAAASPLATTILRQTTRKGSFLDDIEGFDADFFGISPREADFLDPQQRIVLELAWEALEHAGIPPLSLRGTETGVFVSANTNDYGRRLLEDIPRTGAYAVNGTTYYGIANRISYFLDLRGPSLAVDTACAGSLTALHVACHSLRAGESPVAIVGGVNIMATPVLNVALEGAGALAPDGRSKAFDKDANGYGRGEGAGVVVLKRLADARRDGDPILALIVGSGVFQDGRSDGMMAPNSEAQEHMLRQAYKRAGIAPSTVAYVEAHGTGTPVGDREEARALAAVFGPGRSPDEPCLIGSLKPNIGHVEAGSGIAGVIKTILALRRNEIPPSLHDEPNPEFDWAASGLRLVGERRSWPANGHPRRAGVSSYGVGGSIAHTILQEAPPAATAPAGAPGRAVYPVSAMSEAGLRGVAEALADFLTENPGVPLASVGHTLSRRRSHLSQRGAVVAGSTAELTEKLRALAAGQSTPGVTKARPASGHGGEVVWVFSGHGAQWSGMGRQLLVDEPVFAQTVDSLADVFAEELGWTPREAILDGGPWSASQVQAMTFAMQVGLAAVWRHYGMRPGAVIGHSVGEIAAAVTAGCLDVREAARFACRRAAALEPLSGAGGMALVTLPFAEARRRLAGRTDVEAAISASPGSTVVSGDRAAVEQLAEQLTQEGLGVWRVDSDIAFHSRHVDAAVEAVAAAAAELTPRPAQVPLYSTALADARSAVARDAGYWVANLRQPVRCAEAVQTAIEDGHRLFLELSSHPVVAHSIRETLEHAGVEDGTVAITMRRNTDELDTLLANLAELHVHGAEVDWARVHPGADLVALPPMAWQHRPYWIFPEGGDTGVGGGGHDPDKHSLLGGRMTVSGAPTRQVWQTYLDMSCRPYPLSHEVVGVEITPAASIINTFALAGERDGSIPAITDIVLRTPLSVVPPRVVQIVLSENTLRLATRVADAASPDDEEHEWITHTTANLDWSQEVPDGDLDEAAIRARLPEGSWEAVDTMFRNMGVGGYAFPWDLDELRRNDQEQLAVMTIVPPPARRATSWAHVIDGALTISAVVVTPPDAPVLWMSRGIEKVAFRGEPPARIVVHSRRSPKSPTDTTDVLVADETGRIVAEVTGLRFAAVEHLGTATGPRDLVHEVVWRPLPESGTETAIEQVLLVGDPAVTATLAGQFEQAGVPALRTCNPEPHTHVPHRCDCTVDLGVDALSTAGAVVVAPALIRDGERPEDAAERAAWTLIRTAQRVAELQSSAAKFVAPQRVWVLTRGVRAAASEESLAHGPLWGIARIVAGEHPELWGGAVDVDEVTGSTARTLLPLLRGSAGEEDVVSVSGGEVTVARLATIERPADGPGLQCRPTGTYLITGGLGGLGLEVARHLADRGARRILLAGRRGLPPRADWDTVTDPQVRRQIDGVVALESLGVTVRVAALDITDEGSVAAALDPSAHGLPPIRGVVHAAGVVNDALVDKVDLDGLREVLGPKAYGGMVLHRLFPPGSLDFFVLFSSCGQFARLTGQTNYAAANSFLDALAAHRNAGGHRETTSIGWTSWRGVGMSEDIGTTMLEANARGLEAVSTSEALRAWSFADRYHSAYQAVLRVLPTPPHSPKPPMFRDLTVSDPGGGEGQDDFVGELLGLPEDELRERVTADVCAQVGAELNLAPEDVELRRPLVELGVDSVMTVALRVRLQRRYGLDLPPTILWAKPTVGALAGHLVESIAQQPAADALPDAA